MRKERLELSRVTPLEPKSSASTNSATFAKQRAQGIGIMSNCQYLPFGNSRPTYWLFGQNSNNDNGLHTLHSGRA